MLSMKIQSKSISLSSGFCLALKNKKVMALGLTALGLSTLAIGGSLLYWAYKRQGTSPSEPNNSSSKINPSSNQPTSSALSQATLLQFKTETQNAIESRNFVQLDAILSDSQVLLHETQAQKILADQLRQTIERAQYASADILHMHGANALTIESSSKMSDLGKRFLRQLWKEDLASSLEQGAIDPFLNALDNQKVEINEDLKGQLDPGVLNYNPNALSFVKTVEQIKALTAKGIHLSAQPLIRGVKENNQSLIDWGLNELDNNACSTAVFYATTPEMANKLLNHEKVSFDPKVNSQRLFDILIKEDNFKMFDFWVEKSAKFDLQSESSILTPSLLLSHCYSLEMLKKIETLIGMPALDQLLWKRFITYPLKCIFSNISSLPTQDEYEEFVSWLDRNEIFKSRYAQLFSILYAPTPQLANEYMDRWNMNKDTHTPLYPDNSGRSISISDRLSYALSLRFKKSIDMVTFWHNLFPQQSVRSSSASTKHLLFLIKHQIDYVWTDHKPPSLDQSDAGLKQALVADDFLNTFEQMKKNNQ